MEGLLQDIRFASRMLRKSPGFTAVALLTLALGIGINTAVFTVTNAALFKGFPVVRDNDRLLYITNRTVSYPDFEDWRAQAKSFAGMAATQGLFKFVSGSSDGAEIYSGTPVTVNTFQVLGVSARLGRDFAAADGIPGAAPVTILSYELWERRFKKDPTVIGRNVQLNGIATSVIGVMPAGFAFPQKQDLWVPTVPTSNVLRRDRPFLMLAVGRVADGVTIATARAEIDTIGRRLESEYGRRPNQGTPTAKNFNEMFIGSSATTLYKAIFGAVGFVLLIACANVANLLLGRALSRSRELSVRMALGAGRWRLIRQLLVESMLLSSLGGILGWWIARTGVRVYILLQRSDYWFADVLMYAIDYRVFAYLVAISVGTGFLFGLAPVPRLAILDVNRSLKDAGRAVPGGRDRKRLSALLIVGEVALTVVLLMGAGVMIRSFLNIHNADVGARTENVLAAYVTLPAERYTAADAQISFVERLQSRLEALPGVDSVAFGIAPTEMPERSAYEIADAQPADERDRPLTFVSAVSPSYFQTLGAMLVFGRDFSDFDRAAGPPVVIVNERFANRNWPGENPVGKRLRLLRDGTNPGWLTVVGLASNVSQGDPTRQQFDAMVYLPLRQRPASGLGILARTHVPPESVAAAFQRELQAVDSQLPFQHLVPLKAWMARVGGAYELSRNIAILLLVFGTSALLLASVGLYAVISHSVSRCTPEIGVRMALGATTGDIYRLVFRQGMLPLGTGIVIGLAASFAGNRVIEAQLVNVSSTDPVVVVASIAVLTVCAVLGCWIPARRAIRIDPLAALKYE